MRQIQVLQFKQLIHATPEYLWRCMLDDTGYRDWTSVFCDGSYYSGQWQQGETMQFLSPSGNGMISVIEVCEPYQFISIKHLGFVVDGKADYDSDTVKRWAPAYENYRFNSVSAGTELAIEQEIDPEYLEYMQNTWPKALLKLKQLAEK